MNDNLPELAENANDGIDRTNRIPILCIVCGAREQNVPWIRHFGVENVCFSCGLFYSRSLGRTYQCRGLEQCEKAKAGRADLFARKCRCCRLQRCIQVGMKPTLSRLSRIKDEQKRQKILAILKRASHVQMEHKCESLVPMTNPISGDDVHLLMSLIYAEKKFDRMFNTVLDLSRSVWEQLFGFRDFRKLVSGAKRWNLMDTMRRERENEIGRTTGNKQKVQNDGDDVADKQCDASFMSRDILFFLELARSMAFFEGLELEDQLLLLSHICMPTLFFCRTFYSIQQKADSFKVPGSGPVIAFYKRNQFHGDRRIQNLAMKAFVHSILDFGTVPLRTEEMVVLRVILFTHTAPSGLSASAQQLLQAEAERHSRLLLRMFQHRLGTLAGARCFDAALRLISGAFRATQTLRQLLLYRDIFYDKGGFANRLPRALNSLVTTGNLQ